MSRAGLLWPAFDIFAQATLQWLALAAAFAIGLVVPRYKVLAACILFVLALAAISAWPYYQSAHPRTLATVGDGEKPLRLASFNTWLLNDDAAAIEQEIRRLNADVVSVLEFGATETTVLDRLRDLYPYQATCGTVEHCHFAILSRLPLSNQRQEMLWDGPPYMQVTLPADYGSVALFAVHTTRFPHSRAQLHQVTALAAMLNALPGRKIVMGDFNASPFSRVTQTVAGNADLVRLTTLPSWPARYGLPQLAIDHIFVSRDIRQIESQAIGNVAGSDHFPITLRVAVPAAP
jgi:endonuclease/exonuclease/phosphatase (EEP) superfamily protein YafD